MPDINQEEYSDIQTVERDPITVKKMALSKVAHVVQNTIQAFEPIYKELEDGYRYLGNETYKPEVKKHLDIKHRPTRSYNLILSQFNMVLGDFIANRMETMIKPLSGGASPQTAETMMDMKTHVEQDNEFSHEVTKFALAGLIKHGYLYPRYTNENHIDGSVVIKNEDEFDIIWDLDARNPLLDDADFWARSRWYNKRQIYSMAKTSKQRAEVKRALEDRDDFLGSTDEYYDDKNHRVWLDSKYLINESSGKYRLVEHHYFRHTTVDKAINVRTGATEELYNFKDEKRKDAYFKFNPELRHLPSQPKAVKRTKIFVPSILVEFSDEPDILQDGTHDLIHLSAFMHYTRYQRHSFGHFRTMKDPQDAFNEFSNIAEEILRKISNPPKAVRKEFIDNWETYAKEGAGPGGVAEIKQDAPDIDQIFKHFDIPKLPFAADAYSKAMMDMLPRLTSITLNMMGESETNQENATLFAHRVQQGRIGLMPFYDAYRMSIQRLWQKVITLIQMNYTDTQLIRIFNTGPTGTEDREFYINYNTGKEIINDLSVGRYKIFVDDGSNDRTSRSIRYIKKIELTRLLAELFGPSAVVPEWLFSDSDEKDIDMIIGHIQSLQTQMQNDQAKQKAAEMLGFIQDSAAKQINMEESTAGTSQKAPGQDNVDYQRWPTKQEAVWQK